MVAPHDGLGEAGAEGGLDRGRAVERREEQQVVQLRPERPRPGADQREVLPGGGPELLHRLDLPLALRPGLLREEPVGMGGEHDLLVAPPAAGMPGHRGASRTSRSPSPHRPAA